MAHATWRSGLAGGIGAIVVAGSFVVAPAALAADATVHSALELQTVVEALGAGPSTVTLAPDFAPVATTLTAAIPANVQLTLTGAGTTVTMADGATGRHFNLTGASGTTVTVDGLTFQGPNEAEPAGDPGGVRGGGLGISNVGEVRVTNTTFAGVDGSNALALGGVGELTVETSSFLGNRAGSGAAIGMPGGVVATITSSTFHKNWGTASGYAGGALRLTGKTQLTVDRSVFSENLSTTRGGAIAFHQMDGTLTIRDSVFEGNRVPIAANNNTLNDGGAIAVNERPITGAQTGQTLISGSTFTNNIAGDEGGALLLQSGNGSAARVENSTFFGNRAQGLQTNFDDTSGGGAIEAFGTPVTLLHNTFVNNYAEKGNTFGFQRGGAVSATGDTAYLPTQPLTLANNLFVGNDTLDSSGNSASSSAYRQVSARAGIEAPAGTEGPGPEEDAQLGLPVLTQEDRELDFPDRAQNPADDGDDRLAVDAVGATNIGVDNGTAIDLSVINREAILGTDTPALAANGSTIVAGDPAGGFAQTPGTFLIRPSDEGYLIGIADNVGAAAPGISADQRGFAVDQDAGAVQQAYVRFDPNGGDWADAAEAAFDPAEWQQRIVQRDDVTRIWQLGPVGTEVALEGAPSTAPAGKVFAGWNTEPGGSGDAYTDGGVTIPAGSLRLFAQWEDAPATQGTVTVRYVDENGDPLEPDTTLTGTLGSTYETEQKAFEGYDFVRVDGAANGEYGPDAQTVTYHYRAKELPPVETGTVVAKYVTEAGAELRSPIVQSGPVGSAYATKQLPFDGYEFVRVDGAPTGTVAKDPTVITYTYRALGGGDPKPPVDPKDPQPPVAPKPSDPLAETGFGLGWPMIGAAGAALIIAGGVLLYGRRRATDGGDVGGWLDDE
ncbi:MucBP domain-containing protein [Leucobacter chromiireducens]|uniref:MucBP domain-containing protein n=2 Tax=Leucobacter chromiireducens TaxID=283877 RepID=UPI0013DE3E21|nr:MucBP domain-containing protein [Leucobacter chromiireducens]